MKFQLVRHATFKLRLNQHTVLVDPMFSLKGSLDPVANAANLDKNPLVDLPITVEEILKDVDALIITHLHRDHLDHVALELLPRSLPVFCQPEDEEALLNHGFHHVVKVRENVFWNGIHINRTGGKHGTGELGKKMGPVSGFILMADGEPSVYIAGDTIMCSEVEEAISNFSPKIIILNGGEAQYLTGDPITMGCEDIYTVSTISPSSQIIVIHMESWNHCLLSRNELIEYVEEHKIQHITVPEDGASFQL